MNCGSCRRFARSFAIAAASSGFPAFAVTRTNSVPGMGAVPTLLASTLRRRLRSDLDDATEERRRLDDRGVRVQEARGRVRILHVHAAGSDVDVRAVALAV
jgi:hypothetical protein